jgi:hypothetical protein
MLSQETRREYLSEAFHSLSQPLTALQCGLELAVAVRRSEKECIAKHGQPEGDDERFARVGGGGGSRGGRGADRPWWTVFFNTRICGESRRYVRIGLRNPIAVSNQDPRQQHEIGQIVAIFV